MNIWHDIDPSRISPERFEALIEIPKGCKTKYELDKATGLLKMDRVPRPDHAADALADCITYAVMNSTRERMGGRLK